MKKTVFEGMTKGKQVVFNKEGSTVELDSLSPIKIILNEPNATQPKNLTKEDVWGDHHSKGMIVARHNMICPHFGDEVPYKSNTVVCKENQEEDVTYWLEYVLGGDCVSAVKKIDGELGLIAIRADYKCW